MRPWRDAGAVIVDAARLLWRHWPVLVFIYLLGAAGHNGFLWLSIAVSERHATVAGFLLPLVPICTLVALILMLRALAPSLPHVDLDADPALAPEPQSQAEAPGATAVGMAGRVRGAYRRLRDVTSARLALLAGTLIPFLTLYVSEGYLREDRLAFTMATYYDEWIKRGVTMAGDTAIHSDRLFIATGWALAALVIVALTVRWLLDRFDLPRKAVGWGLFAGYLEVLWLFLLANQLTGMKDWGWRWIMDRRFSTWVSNAWETFIGWLGPFGDPVGSATGWIFTALGRGDQLILLPIAWLTVGAVVYGRSIAAPVAAERDPGRIARAAARVPAPVRRVWDEMTGSVRGRFTRLTDGVRLLIRAGLVPMLLFCLVFLLARQSGTLAQEAARWLIGPQDPSTRLAFAPHVAVLTDGVYTVVLVVLLAAAIDRIMAATGPAPAGPASAAMAEQSDRGRTQPPGDTPARPAPSTASGPAE